jgi:septal ring factor EnvC (AmiA/AmiB activator)
MPDVSSGCLASLTLNAGRTPYRERAPAAVRSLLVSIMKLLFILLVLCATGCNRDDKNSDYTAQWEAQFKQTQTQLDNADRQAKRTDEQQAKAEEQQKRMDKVLDKWDEQAKRMDAILDKLEKGNGTNK